MAGLVINGARNDYLKLTGWTIPGLDGWDVVSVVD